MYRSFSHQNQIAGLALSLGLIASVANPSMAATFNFSGPNGNLGSSENFTADDGTTVTVNGFKDIFFANPTAGNIAQTGGGIGIIGQPPASTNVLIRARVGRNTDQIEALEFLFDEEVTLNSINFSGFDGGSEFTLRIDNSNQPSAAVANNVLIEQTGTSFIFAPSNPASNFGILGMEVTTQTTTTQTPEPNTLLGLMTLGTLGFISRLSRKKS